MGDGGQKYIKAGKLMNMTLPAYAQEEYLNLREDCRHLWFKKFGETLTVVEIMMKGMRFLKESLQKEKEDKKEFDSNRTDVFKYSRIKF